MLFRYQTRFSTEKNNHRNSRHTFSIWGRFSAQKISRSIKSFFQCTVHRLVTPAKIWSRLVATAAPLFPLKFSRHVYVQEPQQRVPANSPSAHFSTAKWILPRPRQ